MAIFLTDGEQNRQQGSKERQSVDKTGEVVNDHAEKDGREIALNKKTGIHRINLIQKRFPYFPYKSKGNLVDILPVGIAILSISIVMMSFLCAIQLVSVKTQAHQIARNYMLRMETAGYLAAYDQAALIQQLENLGIQTPDFSGSTMHEVSYGNQITLHIRGKIVGKSLLMNSDLLQAIFEKLQFEFEVILASTAKQ
ncbi:MAG: hypothetical protein LBM69_07975 [Lachnospiraceae bacterium]|jgi:hypothetical protein|nr:hypothetical protein [Lachnospiraceae bacterium]